MVNTKISLCGEVLDNPIIAAAGTFHYGYEMASLYDINMLGSFSCKGTTLEPRFGNPSPRIAEAKDGVIISIGLENPGVDAVIHTEFPRLQKVYHKKIFANCCGFSPEEFAEVAYRMDQADVVGFLEINISCPNVKGASRFSSDPALAKEVTRLVKARCHKPVFVKLSPNVTDIVSIALACEEGGADGISLINCIHAMRIDLKSRKPVLALKKGGLSGPAIFPIALRMVYDVSHAVHIPVIGIGGIETPEDVLEMMMAGASAVEVGAMNLVDPYIGKKLVLGLPEAMKRYGISDLSSIIGVA